MDRLDFRRSLVPGLRTSPKRDGWTRERSPAVSSGEERGLVSRTANFHEARLIIYLSVTATIGWNNKWSV